MADRRRVNGPPGGTAPPMFASSLAPSESILSQRPTRTRASSDLRKIFLKTGITPTASGSAYLELQPTAPASPPKQLLAQASTLKITCAIHGPRPLPRSAAFSAQLVLTTTVKFAPFATRQRRGYLRDSTERDLGAHLETALRAVIIGDRWPKSGVEVVITILEGEEDRWWADELFGAPHGAKMGSWGLLNVLAGCITVSSAALADAGIDCVGLVSGGVSAMIRNPDLKGKSKESEAVGLVIEDPNPCEHQDITSACVVGYVPTLDEITDIWLIGDLDVDAEKLIDGAVEAALAANSVLVEAVQEAVKARFPGVTA